MDACARRREAGDIQRNEAEKRQAHAENANRRAGAEMLRIQSIEVRYPA